MTLQEIFDQLSHGELAHLSIGGEGVTGIPEDMQERVISSINLGLTELHKRFLLRERQVGLVMQLGQQMYWMDRKYLMGTSGTGVKYLKDSVAMPFDAGLLKIEQVYDADGLELMLNRAGDSLDQTQRCVRTPSYNSLLLPLELPLQELKVVYRANHPLLVKTPGYFNPASVEVELPYTHLEALLYYVASRITNPMGLAGGGAFHEGNNYSAKFEAACAVLDGEDFRNEESQENYRLYRNGWE